MIISLLRFLLCRGLWQNTTFGNLQTTNDFYAINDVLAIQIAVNITMSERYYSHRTTWLRKEILAGKRNELMKELDTK
jgi:hypothetical protein